MAQKGLGNVGIDPISFLARGHNSIGTLHF